MRWKICTAAAMMIVAASSAFAPGAQARDVKYDMKIADVLQDAKSREMLGSDIHFFFADQPTPPVAKDFGVFVTNRKTNSFGKPDDAVCKWAMLSALVELRKQAEGQGGNAVINVVSYYKKVTMASTTDYECHAGGFVGGVALKGQIVKLAP